VIVRAVVRVILRANAFFSTDVRHAPAECGGARNSVGHYHIQRLSEPFRHLNFRKFVEVSEDF
jgi:hypothetical protein